MDTVMNLLVVTEPKQFIACRSVLLIFKKDSAPWSEVVFF
jgi:hypothetical protein